MRDFFKLMVAVCFSSALFGVSAMAASCPELTGNYRCVGEDNEVELMEITQFDSGAYTHYQLGGIEIITDGTTRKLDLGEDVEFAEYSATCNLNSLDVDQHFIFNVENQYLVELNAVSAFSLSDADELVIHTHGTVSVGDYSEVVDDLMNCERLK